MFNAIKQVVTTLENKDVGSWYELTLLYGSVYIKILVHIMALLQSISARVSSRDPIAVRDAIGAAMDRGMIAGMIWKRSCMNLFTIYKLLYEADEKNEIIK